MYYVDPNQGNPADAFLVYCSFSLGGQTCLSPIRSQVKHSLRLLSGLISDPERLLWHFVPWVLRKRIRICVLQVPVKAWLKDSQEDSFSWLSRTEQGFQVRYTQSSGDLLPFTAFFFIFLLLWFSVLKFEYTETSVVQMRFLLLNSKQVTQNITFSCGQGSRQGSRERAIRFLADSRRQSFLGTLRDCVVCFFSHYFSQYTWLVSWISLVHQRFFFAVNGGPGYKTSRVGVPVWNWKPGAFADQRLGVVWPQWPCRGLWIYYRTCVFQLETSRRHTKTHTHSLQTADCWDGVNWPLIKHSRQKKRSNSSSSSHIGRCCCLFNKKKRRRKSWHFPLSFTFSFTKDAKWQWYFAAHVSETNYFVFVVLCLQCSLF